MSEIKPGDVIKPNPNDPDNADHWRMLVCRVHADGGIDCLDVNNNVMYERTEHWIVTVNAGDFDVEDVAKARAGKLNHRFGGADE